VPSTAFHVTALLLVDPATLAVNGSVAPVSAEAVAGDTVTAVTVGLGGGLFAGAALTVIVADPALLGSATLVAVTIDVPAVAGALYTPAVETLPLDARHVTALLVVDPVTLAVNVSVPPTVVDALAGDTFTAVTVGLGGGLFVGAALTVIVADPALLGSATLVAVTIEVPAVVGALYTPDAEMLPLDERHVTARFVVVPLTDAVNVSVPPAVVDALAGVIATEFTPDPVGTVVGAFTVTTADADLLGSATLVAVTVPVPADAGAVYTPVAETVPIVAVHCTASLVVVPCTAAWNCTLALGSAVATVGVTETDVTVGLDFVPWPFSDATTGRCAASVMIARLPSTVPAPCAENFTENVCV
jgi:Na+-transporting NADH:ubiquinone oxidoreductase subunit NqrD